MKVAFTDIDQQSVNGRTARAVNRATGEVHTVTIADGEADFGQLTYQQAYEVYGVTASGARVTQVLVKTETNEPEPDLEAPTSAPSLSATVVSDTRIDLDIGSVSGATGYEYRVDGGTPVDVGTSRTPQVTGLTAETQYSFEARAYNAEGAGPWSSVVQATTEAAGAGVVLTESFDKPDGPGLGPDLTWTFYDGDAKTVSGVAVFDYEEISVSPVHARAEETMLSADQYCEMTVVKQQAASSSSSVNVAPAVRVSGSEPSYIHFTVTGNTSDTRDVFRIFTLINGTNTAVKAEDAEEPVTVPYISRLEVAEIGGGEMRARGFINGTQVIEYIGPSILAGNRRAGLRVTGGITGGRLVEVDNFEAGDL